MFEAKPAANTDAIIPAVNHSLARFKFRDDVRPKIHYVTDGVIFWQIIAWLVRNGGVTPITVQGIYSISDDEAAAIVAPNGLFVEPDVGSWKSAHDWQMDVLIRWQRRAAVAA